MYMCNHVLWFVTWPLVAELLSARGVAEFSAGYAIVLYHPLRLTVSVDGRHRDGGFNNGYIHKQILE